MTGVTFLDGRVELRPGDCLAVLKGMADASVDSVVTDPPYALVSIVKRFGKPGSASAKGNDAYKRASAGFMGKAWDTGDVAFSAEFWAEVLRVLKPGGHVAAFSGTRTYHRLACSIEDAGFEIRDQLAWVYGSGFPKSHDVSKAIDRHNGEIGPLVGVRPVRPGVAFEQASPALTGRSEIEIRAAVSAVSAVSAVWQGYGTALKPAWEPICLARRPLIGTVAENVLAHGTGALNIDGCRVGGEPSPSAKMRARVKAPASCRPGHYGETISNRVTPERWAEPRLGEQNGRWPANIVHDGSDEVLAGFPAEAGGSGKASGPSLRNANRSVARGVFNGLPENVEPSFYGDTGSAARFFYSAKADKGDRIGSKHPTVKPVDLMQWLCRLITPPGGLVLDPFAGTGTTGEAAFREGFRAVLVEREAEYQADIARRMGLALAGREERARESLKARGLVTPDAGPLFGGDEQARGGADRSTATLPTKANDWPDRAQKVRAE
jgi:site-specific DNA-methyltransferase (adenine-specific)